jgi:hypothetical protein
MYLHFSEYIYSAYYNNDLILLDVQRDKYTICNEEVKKSLDVVLKHELHYSSGIYLPTILVDDLEVNKFSQIIVGLIQAKILDSQPHIQPQVAQISKKVSSGVSADQWLLKSIKLGNKPDLWELTSCLWMLLKIRFLLKTHGIKYIINKIKENKPQLNYSVSLQDAYDLENKLNQACLIFPYQTKCLEWSVA